MKPFFFALSLIGFLVLTVAAACADHSHGFQRASEAYSAGDYATAVHLWGEEAVKGEVEAQEMLGAMYAAGKGVKQNYAEAIKWYRMAAEAGRVSAQYALGNFYYDGQGVAVSKVDAYAWWLVSAANGNKTAKGKLEQVKRELSSEEEGQAQQAVVNILMLLAE